MIKLWCIFCLCCAPVFNVFLKLSCLTKASAYDAVSAAAAASVAVASGLFTRDNIDYIMTTRLRYGRPVAFGVVLSFGVLGTVDPDEGREAKRMHRIGAVHPLHGERQVTLER